MSVVRNCLNSASDCTKCRLKNSDDSVSGFPRKHRGHRMALSVVCTRVAAPSTFRCLGHESSSTLLLLMPMCVRMCRLRCPECAKRRLHPACWHTKGFSHPDSLTRFRVLVCASKSSIINGRTHRRTHCRTHRRAARRRTGATRAHCSQNHPQYPRSEFCLDLAGTPAGISVRAPSRETSGCKPS